MSYAIIQIDNVVDVQNFSVPNSATQVITLFSNATLRDYRKVFFTNNDTTNTIFINFSVTGTANVSSTNWVFELPPGQSVSAELGRGAVAQLWAISSASTPKLNMVFGA